MPENEMNVLWVSGSNPGILSQSGHPAQEERRSMNANTYTGIHVGGSIHTGASEHPHLDDQSTAFIICTFKMCFQKAPPVLECPHLNAQSTVVFILPFKSCVQEASLVAGQECDPLTRERGGQLQPHHDPPAARGAVGSSLEGRGERREDRRLAAHCCRADPDDRGRSLAVRRAPLCR